MTFFTDPDGNDLMLHHRYAPYGERAMFVLIPGAGGEAWYWHLVAPRLRERGHEVVSPDLPAGDEDAGLAEYADAVVDAVGDRGDLTVVAQSMGAFVAPLLCDRLDVRMLILVAPMIPAPGESPAVVGVERSAARDARAGRARGPRP